MYIILLITQLHTKEINNIDLLSDDQNCIHSNSLLFIAVVCYFCITDHRRL